MENKAITMLRINMQLEGVANVELTPENFPRLFSGSYRVRDISIISTDDGIDIQTILNADEIKTAIIKFLRKQYQSRW